MAGLRKLTMIARKSFPGKKLVAVRVDVASAYNRILNSLLDMCHQCFLFSMDIRDHVVAIPIVNTFGIQAYNYEFGALSKILKLRFIAHLLARSPLPLLIFATNDVIFIGPLYLVKTELQKVASDFIFLCSECVHAADKDLIGEAISIIGFHFDMHISLSKISLTEKVMSLLFTLFWMLVLLDVVKGGPVSNKMLQRVRYNNI
jgi:hypothetical protein